MAEFGYTLSSEEFEPGALVEQAKRAERAGFSFAVISDHFHPWLDAQGQSPFVWSVLGAIAQTTSRIRVGTGVTCPTVRLHPAIVAQAAATTAAMMPGRFFLGLGSGEALNEHIVGERWPSADERIEMLEEAIDVIRGLWTGELQSHRGPSFVLEDARLYTLPEEPPPVYVAASGQTSARLAASSGDGLIGTSPERETVDAYRQGGGDGPRIGQMTVCWAETEDEARRVATEVWPQAALKGALKTDLRLPSHFREAVSIVREDDVAKQIVCGPDPERHLGGVRAYLDAGYDHVYFHQIGPDQEGFIRFWERELAPKL